MRSCSLFGVIVVAALLSAACDDTAQVVARPAYLAASTDVIDFGNIAIGESEQRALFLINKGDLPMVLGEPAGTTYGNVFKVIMGGDQVAPTESMKIPIIFTPEDPIDYESEFVFTNDSVNEPNYKVIIKGSGKQKDPCKDKVCNSPPAAFCANSMTSRAYNPVGRCEAGNCVYDPLDQTCGEFGCDSAKGYCAGDPCEGKSCQEPPNACFLQLGLCQRGACIYTANDGGVCNDGDPCTINDSCAQGNCHGTRLDCSGEPVQKPVCISGTKLKKWQRTGACNAGECVETPIEIDCSHGCETVNNQGQCKGDPCAVPYDDGNLCTEEYCDNYGWHTRPKDGVACNTGSGSCPRGVCNAGACLAKSGESCTAEIETSLCSDQDVPGTCQGDGRCLPNATPQNDRCRQECPGSIVCLFCEIIPNTGIGITLCL